MVGPTAEPDGPRSVFVFAGAGASFGMPAALPLFNSIRDELLRRIGLGERVPTVAADLTGAQAVVRGLAPEPFLLALQDAAADVEHWLSTALDVGEPNAVHSTLGQLLHGGARVWTVNFDPLIERSADPALPVQAWPADPHGEGVCKPHGTVGGRLVFTSKDVLAPVGDTWRARLESDVAACSHLLFVGYSARDLDLQPLWTSLSLDRHVLWFDLQMSDEELTRRRAVVRDAASVTFLPSDDPATKSGNPSVAFVQWCTDRNWTDVDPAQVDQLDAARIERPFPELDVDRALARAKVHTLLGEVGAAQRIFLRRSLTGPRRRTATAASLALLLNHGAPGVLPLLRAAAALPGRGRTAGVRTVARRKRLTLLANAGRHEQVLAETNSLGPGDVSTLWLLRAAAVRFTGSLDEAAALAAHALTLAKHEQHNVRIAHAAFQRTYALMWAGDLPEARRCLDDELRPHASLAAARWVAWADVLEASLTIHAGDPAHALRLLSVAESRFLAEGLVDGAVSAMAVSLTAHRQAGNEQGWLRVLAQVEQYRTGRGGGRYYARGHVFSEQAVALERGASLARFRNDDPAACAVLREVAGSRYPVHAAIAELYLARHDPAHRDQHAQRAGELATFIDARELVRAANEARTGVCPERFFP